MNTVQLPNFILRNPASLIQELEPIDRGEYYILRCPSCDNKEAFLYKGHSAIICNRRNKCEYKEDLSIYLMETNDIQENELLDYVVKTYGKNVELFIEEKTIAFELEIPEGLVLFDKAKKTIVSKRPLNYLHNRNIPEKNIKELGFIYEPTSQFHQTIFIPFYEENELVYFQCRDYTGSSFLRYINPSGGTKKFVYNIDKIEEDGDVFIFEGVFDCLSLKNQVGTATLGSTLGKEQAIKICSRLPKNIVFIPDNDKTGINNIDKNVSCLMYYKPPSLNINILVYHIDNKYKDFNNSGMNHILMEDCVKWRRGISHQLRLYGGKLL